MKYLKKYHQLIKEATQGQESLVAEVYKEIEDNNYIVIDKEKFNAISFVIDYENFTEREIKIVSSKLDKIKIDNKVSYYEGYNSSDLNISYNKITGNFRDKLTIAKYVDDYYTIKNEWGEIGQFAGNIDYYFCDDISGVFKLIQDILWFYSENEEFIKKHLTKTSPSDRLYNPNTYLRDILINNDIDNDYKYNLLFYKNPIAGELIIKKLIEEEGNIIEILKEYKLFLASNLMFLLDKGYITKEVILEFYPNQFRIIDNQLYLIFKGYLEDFEFLYKKEDKKLFIEVTQEDRDYDFNSRYDDIDHIYTGELTEKALNAIKMKIEEVKKTLDAEELKEFEEYDNWEKQVKNIDALSEVESAILRAYNDAQSSADEEEKYNAAISPLKDILGTEEILRDSEGNILFKFNKDWLLLYDNLSDSREECYMGNKLTNTEKIGRLGYWILKYVFDEDNYEDLAPELLEINMPYYGWNGDIDKEYLEELIIDNLRILKKSDL